MAENNEKTVVDFGVKNVFTLFTFKRVGYGRFPHFLNENILCFVQFSQTFNFKCFQSLNRLVRMTVVMNSKFVRNNTLLLGRHADIIARP